MCCSGVEELLIRRPCLADDRYVVIFGGAGKWRKLHVLGGEEDVFLVTYHDWKANSNAIDRSATERISGQAGKARDFFEIDQMFPPADSEGSCGSLCDVGGTLYHLIANLLEKLPL